MQRAAEVAKLKIGENLPYFSLRGTDGKFYSPAELAQWRILSFVFTCNHCPAAQAYEPRLCDLSRRYQPAGVQFLAVCSNDSASFPTDSFEQMVKKSTELGFPFPYLHDEEQSVARAFDAVCTPECFVFDQERKLRYHGRVDDNEEEARVKRHDLTEALDALLRGESPSVPLTSVSGCSIKWKR
jgi:peroxiredoxin